MNTKALGTIVQYSLPWVIVITVLIVSIFRDKKKSELQKVRRTTIVLGIFIVGSTALGLCTILVQRQLVNGWTF